MGRRRRQRERRLEEVLARALSEGLKAGEKRAYERVLFAAAEEVLGLEVDDVERFIREAGTEKALPLITEAATTVWPAKYRERLSPVLSAMMRAATSSATPVLGSFTLANPRIAGYFKGYLEELGRGLSETSRETATGLIRTGLEEGLSNPDVARRIREKLPEVNANRATLIARTETTRAANGASLIQAKESGVVKGKTWIATNDSRTRAEHRAMHGETVGVDEPFSNGLQSPGEPNCRCTTTFVIDFEALEGKTA